MHSSAVLRSGCAMWWVQQGTALHPLQLEPSLGKTFICLSYDSLTVGFLFQVQDGTLPTLWRERYLQVRREVPIRARRTRAALPCATPQVQDGVVPHLPLGGLLPLRPSLSLHPQRRRSALRVEPTPFLLTDLLPGLIAGLLLLPSSVPAAISRLPRETPCLQQDLQQHPPPALRIWAHRLSPKCVPVPYKP